jgi:hypothetical protein
LVIDEEGVETLVPELLRGINDSQVVWPVFLIIIEEFEQYQALFFPSLFFVQDSYVSLVCRHQ